MSTTAADAVAAGARIAGIRGVETLATRVARWARERPDELAISSGDARLSWRALDERVDAIAETIAAHVDVPASRVVVMAGARSDAIAALLGVVRSGNTFVVVDPADPDERLRYIVADADPALVLVDAALVPRAAALAPARCSIVDADCVREARPARRVRSVPEGDGIRAPVAHGLAGEGALACIAYTSGSTGRPKGVCHTHAGMMHFADGFRRKLGLGAGDRVSSFYSLAFAAGLSGLARTVAAGAALCLYDMRVDGLAGLPAWIEREGLTVLQLYGWMLRELEAGPAAARKFATLRLMQISGDTTYGEDVDRARALTLPHCRFLHQLASTEVSIVTQMLLDWHDTMDATAVIPVGLPFDGVRVELRREDGSRAGVDEPGAIVAFSRHVCAGYWRRPDLDAAAFVADPLDPLARGYRMGDVGRFDAEGRLHFMGRADTRVKVRGHTVDLAEVEAALLAWPGGAQCAAGAEEVPGDAAASRIVAYVVARDKERRDPRAVKAFVAGRLPRHMVPAEVRFLDALPRSPSGKLMRTRLAQAPALAPDVAPWLPPRDATEAAVAFMFAELLDLGRAGRDADFFLDGGDSLRAADLQTRISDAFGVRLTGFHEDATVAGVAAAIREALAAPEGP